MPQDEAFFTAQLLDWHDHANARSLPWKGVKDPYRIWLSEIILQQTRAEQGLPYYERFLEAYPTVTDLARAPDDEVFRHWQGLGYYNRCRNLLATARHIAFERGGAFPQTFEELLSLKGVGQYTAAAIASFAYNLPQAVVDGNVYRVLARYCGIDTPSDSTEGKRRFQAQADALLDRERPGAYNQAIMDLGATVCTPLAPRCEACPVSERCFARRHGVIGELPVKAKKTAVRQRYFHYLLLLHEGQLWIRKRSEGIWSNLHEPFLIEAGAALDRRGVAASKAFQGLDLPGDMLEYEGELTHKLTHQTIGVRFFTVRLEARPGWSLESGNWVSLNDLDRYAFPRVLVLFFEKKSYF